MKSFVLPEIRSNALHTGTAAGGNSVALDRVTAIDSS